MEGHVQEATADLPGSVEDLKKSDSNPETAVEAEAEAISRGLQVMLCLQYRIVLKYFKYVQFLAVGLCRH